MARIRRLLERFGELQGAFRAVLVGEVRPYLLSEELGEEDEGLERWQ